MAENRESQGPAEIGGLDIEAVNEGARELRPLLAEGGVERVLSEMAGETIKVVDTGKAANVAGKE
jgi:hypothetical protein